MNKTPKERLENVNKQIIQQDIDINGLTTDELNALMKPYNKDGFIGTISSDQIKSLLPRVEPKSRIAFIMNTSPHTIKTGHWVSCYIDAREDGDYSFEYYNSLCDKPTAKFLKDMKPIIEKLDAQGYLTMKLNKIRDQNFTSNNCGFFASKFLISRFMNKSFSNASGYDRHCKIEEMQIEKWKKKIGVQPFLHMYSGQAGGGWFSTLKNLVTTAFTKVKQFLSGQRGHAGPYVRKYLEAYGKENIIGMKVCRKPIFGYLDVIANYLSNGQFDKNKAKMNYPKMFHLFMLVKITDGNRIKTVMIEKNQTVVIHDGDWVTKEQTETEHINVPSKLTLIDLFINAEKLAGSPHALFDYNPVSTNCQQFQKDLIKGSNMWTDHLEKFVMQNVKDTLEGLGYLENIATGATDLAGRLDYAYHGENNKKHKLISNIKL